jgi:hypothetical protein
MCGALSDDRTSLSSIIVAGSRQCSHSRMRYSRSYFNVPNLILPNLEAQIPELLSLWNSEVQALESLSVASYNCMNFGI